MKIKLVGSCARGVASPHDVDLLLEEVPDSWLKFFADRAQDDEDPDHDRIYLGDLYEQALAEVGPEFAAWTDEVVKAHYDCGRPLDIFFGCNPGGWNLAIWLEAPSWSITERVFGEDFYLEGHEVTWAEVGALKESTL